MIWLEDTKAVRTCLKIFWDKARMAHRSFLESVKCSEVDILEALRAVSYDSSPEYACEQQLEEEAVLALVQARSVKQSKTSLAEAHSQSDWCRTEDAPLEIPTRLKEKVKTRPKATIDSTSDGLRDMEPPAESIEDSSDTPPILRVKPESYSVFQRMFSGPESNGTTKWRQLLGAMVDAGFAVNNRGGSVVNFDNGHGSIDFHKPHPIGELSKNTLSALGKRMTRHFGWNRETFVRREATKATKDVDETDT